MSGGTRDKTPRAVLNPNFILRYSLFIVFVKKITVDLLI